jgi:uncharacterized membrane protein
MKGVQFTVLVLFALVAGVFWGTWVSLSRSMTTITPATFLEVGHTMIGNLGGLMSILMPAALVSGIVLAVMLIRRGQRRSGVFAIASLILLVAALIITLVINVPIDGQIQSWNVTTLPNNWTGIRDRWEFFHGLRTIASLASLACVFGSTLSLDSTISAVRTHQDRREQRTSSPRTAA